MLDVIPIIPHLNVPIVLPRELYWGHLIFIWGEFFCFHANHMELGIEAQREGVCVYVRVCVCLRVCVCVEVYFPSGVLVLNCFPPNLPLLHSRWQFTALLCVCVSVSWKKLLGVRSIFNAMLHSPYIKKSPTSTFTHHIFLHYYSFIPSNWLKIWLWSQTYFFSCFLKAHDGLLKNFHFLSLALMVIIKCVWFHCFLRALRFLLLLGWGFELIQL